MLLVCVGLLVVNILAVAQKPVTKMRQSVPQGLLDEAKRYIIDKNEFHNQEPLDKQFNSLENDMKYFYQPLGGKRDDMNLDNHKDNEGMVYKAHPFKRDEEEERPRGGKRLIENWARKYRIPSHEFYPILDLNHAHKNLRSHKRNANELRLRNNYFARPRGGKREYTRPRGGKRDTRPRGGKRDTRPRGGKRDTRPRGGKRDMRPRGGKRDTRPRGGKRDMRPRGGKRDTRPRGGKRSAETMKNDHESVYIGQREALAREIQQNTNFINRKRRELDLGSWLIEHPFDESDRLRHKNLRRSYNSFQDEINYYNRNNVANKNVAI